MGTQLSCLHPNLNDSVNAQFGSHLQFSDNLENVEAHYLRCNSGDTEIRRRGHLRQQLVEDYADAKRHAEGPERSVRDFARKSNR